MGPRAGGPEVALQHVAPVGSAEMCASPQRVVARCITEARARPRRPQQLVDVEVLEHLDEALRGQRDDVRTLRALAACARARRARVLRRRLPLPPRPRRGHVSRGDQGGVTARSLARPERSGWIADTDAQGADTHSPPLWRSSLACLACLAHPPRPSLHSISPSQSPQGGAGQGAAPCASQIKPFCLIIDRFREVRWHRSHPDKILPNALTDGAAPEATGEGATRDAARGAPGKSARARGARQHDVPTAYTHTRPHQISGWLSTWRRRTYTRIKHPHAACSMFALVASAHPSACVVVASTANILVPRARGRLSPSPFALARGSPRHSLARGSRARVRRQPTACIVLITSARRLARV